MTGEAMLVGGSLALHDFTAHDPRTTWHPNDVDVFVGGNPDDHRDFDRQVFSFIERCKGRVVKTNVFDHEDMCAMDQADTHKRVREETSLDPLKEDFHNDIFKTVTASLPYCPLPVQFVGIGVKDMDLRSKLTQITDIPSSVTFSHDAAGQRVYHIPEKLLPSLWSRRIPKSDICPARVDKYGARGYTFVDE